MKKILALILVLVMLGSLAATCVSAEEEYVVNWEAFTNSRGMNVYIGEATEDSPVVDGLVEPGEYPYSKYTGSDQIYNYSGGEIESGVTEYFAHDADYVYYAVEFQQSAFNRAFQWQFKPFNSFDIYGDSTDLTKYYYTRVGWQARHTEDNFGNPYTNYFDSYAPSINGDCVRVPDVYGGEELICASTWGYNYVKTYEVRLSKTYLAEVNNCDKEDIRVIPYFTYFHSISAVGHIYTSDDLLAISEVCPEAFTPVANDVGYMFMVLDTEDSAPEFIPPEAPEIGEIAAGDTKIVNIDEPSDVKMFIFCPTISGAYEFYSTGTCVPMGMIFNSEGEVLEVGFDSSLSSNFSVTYNFEAGEIYILAVSLLDSTATGSFAINIELTDSELNDDLWYSITKEMGLHIYIGDYKFRAPIQDGVVDTNEYTYSRYTAPSDVYNYAGGEIQSGVTEYFAHDDEYVYYAAVFKQTNDNRAFQWQFRPFNTFDIYRDNSDWTQYYYSRIMWQARYIVNGYGYSYTDYSGSYAPTIFTGCVRTPEIYDELICEAQKTASGYKTYEVAISKAYLAEVNGCDTDELFVIPYFTYFHSSAGVGHVYTAEDIATLYDNGATVSFDAGVGELGYMFIVLGNDPDAEEDVPNTPDNDDELYPIDVGESVTPPTMAAGESMVFEFKPSVSGKYDFYSTGNYDTVGNIISSDSEILYTDDNSGYKYNFHICAYLETGKTYYLQGMIFATGRPTFTLELHTHTWDDGVITKEPTPEEEGVKTYTCECGEILTESVDKVMADTTTETTEATTRKPSQTNSEDEDVEGTAAASVPVMEVPMPAYGCEASMAISALVMIPIVASGALVFKKRKED